MVWWKNADDIDDIDGIPEVVKEVKEMLGRPASADKDPTEEFPVVENCTNCGAVKPQGAPWCSSCGFNF